MTLLEILVEYGVSNGVLTGDGEDSFRDFMPELPDDLVAFQEYDCEDAHPYDDFYHRSIQVKVRSIEASEARSKAIALYLLFKSETESLRIDFSDDVWGQVYVRQAPVKLEQDESGRTTYDFNLGITTNIIE